VPFRLDYTVWTLRRRSRNEIDRWDGTTYRRIVMIGGRVTELAVRQSGSSAVPRITVTATPPLLTLSGRREARSIVNQLLGLQIDLAAWYRLAHVLLRGLARLHVFPGDDVGAQKSLARWLRRSRPLDYGGVSRALERWQPYAGMLYFHLLLDGLAKAGSVEIRS
jgi:hypothetical protein